jgi:hypothetical protein
MLLWHTVIWIVSKSCNALARTKVRENGTPPLSFSHLNLLYKLFLSTASYTILLHSKFFETYRMLHFESCCSRNVSAETLNSYFTKHNSVAHWDIEPVYENSVVEVHQNVQELKMKLDSSGNKISTKNVKEMQWQRSSVLWIDFHDYQPCNPTFRYIYNMIILCEYWSIWCFLPVEAY